MLERGIYERVLQNGEKRFDIAATDRDGKLYWTTARSLKEARSVQAARHNAKDNGRGLLANQHTVDTLAAQYLESLDAKVKSGALKAATVASARKDLTLHVSPVLGHVRLKNLQVGDGPKLIDALRAKGLAESTNRLAFDAFARLLSFGRQRNLLAVNICKEMGHGERPSSRTKNRATPFEPEELRAILDKAHSRWRLLFFTAAWTGLRQGEILGLRWGDVDFDASRINVRGQLARGGTFTTPKTHSGTRTIEVLAAPLMTELRKAYLAAEDKKGYVFVTEDGRPRHHHVCLETFRSACRRAGLGDRVFHDLRHTAASRWIAAGFDPVYVAAQLGHSKPSLTLDTYSHLYAQHRRTDEAREQLSAEAAGMVAS